MDRCISSSGEFVLDRTYYVGENRPIEIGVHDARTATYTITTASYQVIDDEGNVTAQGSCNIDNEQHVVGIYFHPDAPGIYTIEYTITVQPAVKIINLIAKVKSQKDNGGT